MASAIVATRYPAPVPERLPEDQRQVYERIVQGRGKLPLPYRAALASPGVAVLLEQLSTALWNGVLPQLVLETVFLCVARHNQCAYQWDSHIDRARTAGLDEDSIVAIRAGKVPERSSAAAVAAAFTLGLQNQHRVTDTDFAAVHALYGDKGVAELATFVGVAQTIACLLNLQASVPAVEIERIALVINPGDTP